MRERPIDRPVIKWWPGDERSPKGWKVTVNYDSGTREHTWLTWRAAVRHALAQCGPRDIRPRVMAS